MYVSYEGLKSKPLGLIKTLEHIFVLDPILGSPSFKLVETVISGKIIEQKL